MSHEIRSPLGVILGFAELLANPSRNPEEVRHYAGRIRNSIEHLTALVDEVLDIAKIEAGKLEVEVLRFPLLPELAETLSSLRSRAEGKGLHFSVEFRGEIPEMLTSNPQRLRQIIFNIVGNAIKFTEQGEIKVQIQCDISAVTPEAGMLTMVVSDTGCGLSEAQQQRLFLPFSQGDTSVTRKHGGTGLGLLLARRLAETLGGEVKLRESTPGAGSCFVLSVSTGSLQGVARLNKLSEADLAKSQSREAPWFVINQKLAGLHLLLVEDGADNQALMLQFLTSSGATVETAGNGVEALAAMEKGTFDLVLMDIQMPVMDGYQATKKLRDKGVITPIIALTAHAMTGERERCLAAGCGEYLSKPVSPTLLIEVVARMAKKTDMEVGVDEGRSLLVNHPVVGPIIGKFVGNLPERQNGLECALQREDYPAIGKLAHQIAGAAEGYGFPEIGTVAALLETQVRDNASPQHLAASIARFNHLCAAIQRAHPREEKKKGTPA
jgi:CheY-like chemotaxis protein/HPt (histidine-containing phosphotransfer) domain-containing protein/anti-sigma regulatory factor (Ser/Thr protein kinase)